MDHFDEIKLEETGVMRKIIDVMGMSRSNILDECFKGYVKFNITLDR
jgi:hypothetical protein